MLSLALSTSNTVGPTANRFRGRTIAPGAIRPRSWIGTWERGRVGRTVRRFRRSQRETTHEPELILIDDALRHCARRAELQRAEPAVKAVGVGGQFIVVAHFHHA